MTPVELPAREFCAAGKLYDLDHILPKGQRAWMIYEPKARAFLIAISGYEPT